MFYYIQIYLMFYLKSSFFFLTNALAAFIIFFVKHNTDSSIYTIVKNIVKDFVQFLLFNKIQLRCKSKKYVVL